MNVPPIDGGDEKQGADEGWVRQAMQSKQDRKAAPPSQWIVQQVQGVQLSPLKVKEHERREAPNSLPKPPFMSGFFGSRGSGKTTCMLQLVRMYDRVRAFDKIVIFTPTHSKDPKFEAFIDSNPNAKVELVENYSDAKFNHYVSEMETGLMDFEKHKKAREAFGKFSKGENVDDMPDDDILALYAYDFMNPDATERFKHGRPSTLIVFDDMVGDKRVYRGDSAGVVGRFALRHRHFNCSLAFLSQAYKSGIPRQLRNNLSLAVFFANKSDRIKEEISEEMSSFISPDDFVNLWNYSTEEPHSFFMIDFDAKDPRHRFRKCFDKIIFSAAVVEQLKKAQERTQEAGKVKTHPDLKKKIEKDALKKNKRTIESVFTSFTDQKRQILGA